MTRTRWALLVALIAVTVATLAWRPWDRGSDALDDAVREIGRLPGVLAVEVERHESDTGPAEAFTPVPSTAEVGVRLDATLTPDIAAAAADSVHAVLLPAAEALVADAVSVVLRVVAGEPEDVNGIPVYPLVVRYSGESGARDVADAYAFRAAGARRVEVYGAYGPVWPEHDRASDLPPGMGIHAADPDGLVPLAELANRLGRPVDMRVGDADVYSAYGTVPDVEAVRLAVAAGSRPGVETAIFSNSTAPQLSIRIGGPADSAETGQLRQWLEAHTYATRTSRPVAYSIFDLGYATIADGWVSGLAPAEPAPHPLPLPDGTDAWPDDPTAPACTGADLEVTFGGSDAATGSRFALLLARNVSAEPCAVEGVPGVVFRNARGDVQQGIGLNPFRAGVVPARVVVPPGEQVRAPLRWRAMSTANDADVTTSIDVTPLPSAGPVLLDVTEHEGSAAGLDILDDADVRLGPWVQAFDDWS